jgi:hypothetical protein
MTQAWKECGVLQTLHAAFLCIKAFAVTNVYALIIFGKEPETQQGFQACFSHMSEFALATQCTQT